MMEWRVYDVFKETANVLNQLTCDLELNFQGDHHTDFA